MDDRSGSSRILRDPEDLPRAFHPRGVGEGHELDLEGGAEPPRDPLELAFERGYEQGREEGEQRATAQFESRAAELRLQLSETLKSLGELNEKMTADYRELLLELSLTAASRIARKLIEEGDPVAARALSEALEALPTDDGLRVHLHPDDVEAVERDLESLIRQRRIEIVSDEKVSRGGCIVGGESGTIDATLEAAEATVRAAADGRADPS
jgi:flagellar assembly protein FliH